MHALLIGYGSIGKRHLAQLERRCQSVAVVDPFVEQPRELKEGTTFHRSLVNYQDEFKQVLGSKKHVDVGVIANWGPGHFETFLEMRKIGVRKFLIEKPVVSRMSDLDSLEEIIARDKLQVWSNYHLRFEKSTNYLRDFLKKNKIGNPSLMTVTGGAKCLATTGVHWIDYFFEFSENEEFTVNAKINIEQINPRSPELSFLEGFINLSKNKCSLNISFTNESYADSNIEIYWKSFKVQISGGIFRMLKSDNPEIGTLPITRTAPFTDIFYEDVLGGSGFDSLYEEFFSTTTDMPRLFDANRWLLESLIYNDSHPIKSLPSRIELRDKDYLIS
jgi:predicted dehydrogenase